MLDTDIAIHLRDENGPVLDRIGELREKPVLSAITRVELEGGVYKIAALTNCAAKE